MSGPGRFELRLPDGAANPYLLQAVIIAAGLSSVKTNAGPGKRWDIDMYAEGHKVTVAELQVRGNDDFTSAVQLAGIYRLRSG